MQNNQKTHNQVSVIQKQFTALLLLWALLTVVFVPSFYTAETNKAPEGMVYCPLSRKFQPVNPPEEKKELKLFEDICASRATKNFLVQEIFIKKPFKQISLNENKLDNLAFDFLAHGESVLKELPNLPDFPSELLIKQFGSGIAVNNAQERLFDRKQPVQYFPPALLARPPTVLSSSFPTNNLVHQSAELSRRIAPRAPPVRS